ncbi:MAG: hypothetical protein QMD99_21925, partial [Rhizobiaceae bacterium]|nr:hypothetical protein [Rhizobiaceae bacterium]
MNHISKNTLVGSRLVAPGIPRDIAAAHEENALTDACISAIEEAVETLRTLADGAAVPARQATATSGRGGPASGVAGRPADPESEVSAPQAASVPMARLPGVTPPGREQEADQQGSDDAIRDRMPDPGPAVVEGKTVEDKVGQEPDIHFGRTIEGDSGPIRSEERRPTPGHGGDGKVPASGGGGGGGGGDGHKGFHKRSGPINFAASLARAIAEANNVIYAEGHSQDVPEVMATTVVVAVIRGRELIIGSVGDSPAYLMRDADVRQLTLDHTVEVLERESGAAG